MRALALTTAALAVAFIAPAAQAQVSIFAKPATPQVIGTFGPGTYRVTTTGIVSLTGTTGFDVDANGIPQPGSVDAGQYPGYAAVFNPNGSYTADGSYGPAGSGVKIGALAGTFTADGSSGYFNLGTLAFLNFAGPTVLYGYVNDTFNDNNTGAFAVTVTSVPEPASWGLMILGFGVAGYVMRRRRVGYVALRTA